MLFTDEKIDIEALEYLIEDDLVALIPGIGNRAKFRIKWNEWKKHQTENRNIDVSLLVSILH